MTNQISLPEHLRNTKRDRERRRALKRTRRHHQYEKARETAHSGGYTEAERREQADPLGADPVFIGQMAKVDEELAGPDPADRVRWAGEPGPEHGLDPRTERERDPVTEFDVDPATAQVRDDDPAVQVEADTRLHGFVEASLYERETGTTDRQPGVNIEATLPDLGAVEDDILEGL
ncbi:hypothetical protein M0R89_10455 [Halorussus limi]|uniref:Uncharacterized protein n=1 Tax=Halorussus limi TaxID=2938695 RepID=A0A8U0HQ35_9EURY|nr:hypothetical protein [Halorussus limi]UPV72969.1 hypothetical protein M0R89_10455 [Halorussus limi]